MAVDKKSPLKPVEKEPVETEEVKGARPRSPNHPSLSLDAAIDRAKLLYDKYARAQVAIALACTNWGYSNPRSSGALSLVAALKAFGVVDVTGQGASQKVAVSEAGERIIRGAPDRPSLLKVAATTPSIHSEVWEHFNKSLPHDDLIKQYLLWERSVGSRFTDDAVDGFIEQLRTTLRFAGLIPGDGTTATENNSGSMDTAKNGNDPKTPPKVVQVGSFVQWTSAGKEQFPQPRKVAGVNGNWVFVEGSPTGVLMSEVTVVDPQTAPSIGTPPANPFFKPTEESEDRGNLEKEQTNVAEGAITMTWPKGLTEESFDEFEYWVNGLLLKARRKAGLPVKSPKRKPADDEPKAK